MGQIDAYIHHLATPMLAAGEGILGVGAFAVVTSTTHGVPATFDLWLAAMTPTRMLCFLSAPQPSGMLGYIDLNSPPKMEQRGAIELRYEWLFVVSEQPTRGRGIEQHRRLALIIPFALFPRALHESAAQRAQWENHPDRRVVHLDCLFAPAYDGLDGQREVHARFISWLLEQKRLGAFLPSAQSLARVEADHAPLHHAAAQTAARRAANAAAFDAWWAPRRHRVLRAAMIAPFVLASLAAAAEAYELYDVVTHSAAWVGDRAASYQTRAVLYALAALGLGAAAVFVGRWSWRNIQPVSSTA